MVIRFIVVDGNQATLLTHVIERESVAKDTINAGLDAGVFTVEDLKLAGVSSYEIDAENSPNGAVKYDVSISINVKEEEIFTGTTQAVLLYASAQDNEYWRVIHEQSWAKLAQKNHHGANVGQMIQGQLEKIENESTSAYDK